MKREFRVGRRTVAVNETIVDRVVGYFSPQSHLERMRARVTMEAAGGYTGGRRDRRQTRNWRPPEGSANADTLPDLPDLRARARDLERNMPIATGAIATTVTNAVGEGLMVSPAIDQKLLGLGDEEKEEWESQAAKEFALASETADFTRALTFDELQALALRSTMLSGDVFALRRFREDAGDVYGTKIQLVEADRISNPSRAADRTGMIGGIAFNADGVPISYQISDRHPGDHLISGGALNWQSVPARDDEGRALVLHLFDRLRPDQARGVPYLAPVIELLKTLGNYTESEATAALVTSMFTVFVTSQTGENEHPIIGESNTTDSSLGANEIKLGQGAIVDLAPGEEPKFADPTRPNTGFDPFVMALCRQMGVALELPYEILIKHFTASYSASRAALETAWQFFRKRRTWIARRFCQPYYEWIIYEAVLRGRLNAPGFFENPLVRRAWLGANWNGPARISLDQGKDATADEKYIAMRVRTRQEVARERFGTDIEQIIPQLGKEERALDAAGLKPVPPPQAAPSSDDPPEPNEDDPVAGGDDTEEEDEA